MAQLDLFAKEPAPPLSVADLTRRVRERLESDEGLQNIWVTGEVSNANQPRSGHFYFTLKDANAALRCVMWKNNVLRLRFLPRDGDKVEVHGGISVYDVGGQYQLYADNIQPAGQGLLYQEFLRLKAELEAEGLFDEARKRPLPDWPRRIGIATSATGAALQDMLNTIRRRFPITEVVLAPTPVQGIDAPPGIVRSLTQLQHQVDVILLARGGGSIEDLWAFNDERVVRAVAASTVPIVTGVGHETDFTLADFAADLRAPTPTAAAELATPDRAELQLALRETSQSLGRLAAAVLSEARWDTSEFHNRLLRSSPDARLRNERQKLDDRLFRLGRVIGQDLRLRKLHLNGDHLRLESANPLAVLGRGFAVVTQPDGAFVRSVGQVAPGDVLSVRVRDGSFGVSVSGIPGGEK